MNNTKTKLSIPQVIRRLIQLGAFILIPGLFISIFSAIKDVYTALISGAFSFSALSYQIVLLLAVIPVTVLMGRFFCGYLCAFGSMGDFLWFISSKLRKKSPHISSRADSILKKLKYVLLFLIVVLVWTLGIVSFSSTANPWTIFGMFASISGWPSASYLLSIGAALLLLIMLGSVFIERFFCRYLCPLGAIFSVLSLPKLFRIKKPRTACGACTLCTSECSMGIPLNQADQVASGECINCFQCVDACPRHNVKANPTPAVATTMAAAAIAGLYLAGNLSSANTASAQGTVTTMSDVSNGAYADGVYTGSASGFRGTTKVQVTVSGGEITDIEVLSTADDAQYFSRAENSVINNILLSQSTEVSTVSGATFSSNAIINAVKNALSTAASSVITLDTQSVTTADATETTVTTSESPITSTTPATSEDVETTTDSSPVTTTETETSTTTVSASGAYADGVYTGSGSGFRGDTSVSVTVTGGVITDITVVSYQDDAPYFNRAQSTVIAAILSQQSIDVSTVSGATFSSNSILEAVANALSIDFTNPNSTLPQHGHGK